MSERELAYVYKDELEQLLAIRDRFRCIFRPCVAVWAHSHGGFPGGYDNPDDPDGPPISFVGPDPEPTAVRDYNVAALR